MPISKLNGDGGDEKCNTFVFKGEGHTLGNALRSIISSYPDVELCGYYLPHPVDQNMHFRIQVKEGTAVDVLKRGLADLMKICTHTEELFIEEVADFKKKNK